MCPNCHSKLDENNNCLECGWSYNPFDYMLFYLDAIYQFGLNKFDKLRREYLQDLGNKELHIGIYSFNLSLN